MAKLSKKTASDKPAKIEKVDKKSVAIQKPSSADKKTVKKLKNVAAKVKPHADSPSPKKQKQPKKKSPAKKLQKKTTPSGVAPIVPKKAKTLKAPATKGGKDLVSREDLAKCVKAFREALKLGLAEKKAMLDPDFKYILQLCSFKVPQCPERIARTQLKHSLVDETDDVCLFVKDLEQGNKRDHQPTIDFYKEKLEAAGITNIKTIIPMSQLAKDYKQHEMIRKLCNSYDSFLADGRIAPHLAKKLGKPFVVYKKSPVSVRMNHSHLKDHFQKAIAKVAYQQTSSGNSMAIYVGKHGMEDEKIVDNIQQLLQNMKVEFPGGWQNLKRVYLRPAINLSKSSILVYANASSGEDVPVPVIEGPRAKALKEKQKQLNDILPDGLVMTNKGELAQVAGKKRPAADGAESAVDKKKKKNAVGEKTKDKKQKKEKVVVAVEATEPAKEQKPGKKDKKAKKEVEEKVVSEEVVVPSKKAKKEKATVPVEEKEEEVAPKKSKKVKAAPEPTPVVEEKPAKKAKKDKVVPADPVEDEESKPKKSKKGKAKATAETEVADADLSKEVSELWEQIKNESGVDLGDAEPKKGKKQGKKPVDKKKAKK